MFNNSPTGATRDDAIGVFSASSTLLATSELNRVVDVIDAGTDRVTDNTFDQNQATDIAEDFRIDETLVQITIPLNARFLFLGNADSKQSDNSNSSGGFSIQIRF
ncbi:MAG: hypothetical protein AAFV80_03975 [Bacteroidota bacterium]